MNMQHLGAMPTCDVLDYVDCLLPKLGQWCFAFAY